MMRFYGQTKHSIIDGSWQPTGYELFIRVWQNNAWTLPADFTQFTPEDMAPLLKQTLAALPANFQTVAFNLEQSQFVDDRFINMIREVQDTTDLIIYTELTERTDDKISLNQLQTAAQKFHEFGLHVCIDDVGTGDNTPELVLALDEYIDEYKFALQNFRPFNTISEITSKIAFWHNLAAEKGKVLVIEGLETKSDLETIEELFPCEIVQGYFLGRPQLMPVA